MMSLLPIIVSDILEDPWRPLFDQHFGLGLLPSELSTSAFGPIRGRYYRPRNPLAGGRSGVSKIENKRDCFKVHLDVQQFKPEEIKVKVLDKFIHIEGKHEERQDEHGYVSREFTRRYALPEDVDLDAVASELSSDGVLTIVAPKKALSDATNGREIPISQTSAPALGEKAEINGEKAK